MDLLTYLLTRQLIKHRSVRVRQPEPDVLTTEPRRQLCGDSLVMSHTKPFSYQWVF